MSDEQLISKIARAWVDAGGDAEGIEWCWRRIRDAVALESAAREQAAQHECDADLRNKEQ